MMMRISALIAIALLCFVVSDTHGWLSCNGYTGHNGVHCQLSNWMCNGESNAETLTRTLSYVNGATYLTSWSRPCGSNTYPSTSGLSCDAYKGQHGVTCHLSPHWMCNGESHLETRTRTIYYPNGVWYSNSESRPCGSGGVKCIDTEKASTCSYWKKHKSYGCNYGSVKEKCCATCESCVDLEKASTCASWQKTHGCSHAGVRSKCCATCRPPPFKDPEFKEPEFKDPESEIEAEKIEQ